MIEALASPGSPPARTASIPPSASDGSAHELLEQLFAEQQALSESMGRLMTVVGDQQERLGRQFATAIELIAHQSVPDVAHPTPLPLVRARPTIVAHCLGTLEVLIDGIPNELRPSKARSLFEYLLLHRKRPVSRETLIEALWPDPEALAAATSLKVAVHSLRRQLPEALTIQAQPLGYQLVAPGLWLDVVEFEEIVERARRLEARGLEEEALDLYSQAAELYRGDLLIDSWDDWVLLRREGLKDQQLFVLARLADTALIRGDYHGCIARCVQILDEDPCREDAFRILILCHARLGQRGRVRRWYELCERMLRVELDVNPAPETVQLYEAATHHGPLPDCRFGHEPRVS